MILFDHQAPLSEKEKNEAERKHALCDRLNNRYHDEYVD